MSQNDEMKTALVVHNPTAGDGKHSKKELLDVVKKSGYKARYVSTHTTCWKEFDTASIDVIFLAGGDGTVHKLVDALLKKDGLSDTIPIHLLPLGTANNIARTIKILIDKNKEHLIRKGDKARPFNYGGIKGLKSANFFLESIGFGIFPELISEMEEREVADETPAEELRRTLQVLLKIVENYEAPKVKMKFDGIKMKGSFLMVEVMNTKYIGPNLKLAPDANPGDDYLNLIMVPEKKRSQLKNHLHQLIEGKESEIAIGKFARRIRVQQVKLKCQNSKVHVDDDVLEDYPGNFFELKVVSGGLEFFENV